MANRKPPPSKKRKEPSGAQKRRARAEKLARDRAEVEARARELGIPLGGAESSPAPSAAPAEEAWADEYLEAGDPDLKHPEYDLAYVRKLQLITLRQMARTRAPTVLQQEHWRRLKDMSAVLGMTSNRAALEAEVKRLRDQLAAIKAQRGAVKVVDGKSVPRPATARGSRGARGPRPLPGSPPRPRRPEEDGNPSDGGGDVG